MGKEDRAKPVYQTIRLSSPVPKIDGELNDNCWLNDANIYVAIRAYDIDLLLMNDHWGVNWNAVWDIYPTDILMLKLNYWFSL